MIFTNAPRVRLCCVLMWHGKVIVYGLTQLEDHEKKYVTNDSELAAIIFALKKRRHYLYGKKFEVSSDHESLRYSFSCKEMNNKQKRCRKYIKDYDFRIKYCPEKANVVAYVLSRKVGLRGCLVTDWMVQFKDIDVELQPLSNRVMLVSMSLWEPEIVNRIKDNQRDDPELVRITDHMEKRPDFSLIDGALYCRDWLCVPYVQDLKREVLTEEHHTRYPIHLGHEDVS